LYGEMRAGKVIETFEGSEKVCRVLHSCGIVFAEQIEFLSREALSLLLRVPITSSFFSQIEKLEIKTTKRRTEAFTAFEEIDDLLNSRNPLFKTIFEFKLQSKAIEKLQKLGVLFVWQIGLIKHTDLVEQLGFVICADVLESLVGAGVEHFPRGETETLVIGQIYHYFQGFDQCLHEFLTEREIGIYESRAKNLERSTLHELGERFGISRERVRQIEIKVRKKIVARFQLPAAAIASLLNEKLALVPIFNYAIPLDLGRVQEINEFIEEIFGLDICFEPGIHLVWSKDLGLEAESMSEHIYRGLLPKFNSGAASQSEISEYTDEVIRDFAGKPLPEISALLVENICSSFFERDVDGLYRAASQKRNDRVAYEFGKFFPTGAYLYRQMDLIWSTLCVAIPELGDSRKPQPGLLGQIFHNHKDLFHWGVGYYIHRQSTPDAASIIEDLKREIIQLFDTGISEFKANMLFDRHYEHFRDAGIPSVQAMYSHLRYHEHPRIELIEYPMIWDGSLKRQCRRHTFIIESFVQAASGKVTSSEIYDHFSKRGWRVAEIRQTLERCRNLNISRNGTVWYKAPHTSKKQK
ncbi:MAG: hypothetical protein KGS72_26745, partial [Cyanobacteria bacterium REEB67]|nr:hypothetical protein [Cyanobacteria bacterium REEB67]